MPRFPRNTARLFRRPTRVLLLAVCAWAAAMNGRGFAEIEATASFAGAVDPGGGVPPDVQGAAGPDHLLVMLNTTFVAQRKSDGAIVRSWTPASFWSPISGGDLLFDPRVLYDALAGRWIAAIATEGVAAPPAILVAVSDGSDPTETWTFRKLALGGGEYGEFPLVGFNARWIVVTANRISTSTGYLAGSAVWAIDKSLGTVSEFTVGSPGSPIAPAATLDADEPDELLLQQRSADDGGRGRANLFRLSVDSHDAPLLSPAKVLTAPIAWRDYPLPLESLPQAGSTRRIVSDQDEFSSVSVRSGKLWAVQTATVPSSSTAPEHTAVQWWRLTRDGALDAFGRIEDPEGATWLAFPSIAVDGRGRVLIGYSLFSNGDFASAGYSFRSDCGGDGQLSGVHVLKRGEGPYERLDGGGRNRWGDLSQTVADPDGLRLWTLQEYAAPPVEGVGRWGTWWGGFAFPAAARSGACLAAAAPARPAPFVIRPRR